MLSQVYPGVMDAMFLLVFGSGLLGLRRVMAAVEGANLEREP
jgi:hypothetical protein